MPWSVKDAKMGEGRKKCPMFYEIIELFHVSSSWLKQTMDSPDAPGDWLRIRTSMGYPGSGAKFTVLKWKKVKVLIAQLCLTLCKSMDCTCQALLPMEFSRQEYWNGLPLPSPGDLPNPGIEPRSLALQTHSSTIWATKEALLLSYSHPKHWVCPEEVLKEEKVVGSGVDQWSGWWRLWAIIVLSPAEFSKQMASCVTGLTAETRSHCSSKSIK